MIGNSGGGVTTGTSSGLKNFPYSSSTIDFFFFFDICSSLIICFFLHILLQHGRFGSNLDGKHFGSWGAFILAVGVLACVFCFVNVFLVYLEMCWFIGLLLFLILFRLHWQNTYGGSLVNWLAPSTKCCKINVLFEIYLIETVIVLIGLILKLWEAPIFWFFPSSPLLLGKVRCICLCSTIFLYHKCINQVHIRLSWKITISVLILMCEKLVFVWKHLLHFLSSEKEIEKW